MSTSTKAIIAIALVAFGIVAYIWVRSAPPASSAKTEVTLSADRQSPEAGGSGAPAMQGGGGGDGQQLSAQEAQRQLMRAWITASLKSLGAVLQLPLPAEMKGQGVPVSSVDSGSPAAKAGMKAGDMITMFDKTAIPNPQSLANLIAKADPSKQYEVVVTRGKGKVTLKLTGVKPSNVSPPAADLSGGSGSPKMGGGME
jgi:S1-C subfamily serine protease